MGLIICGPRWKGQRPDGQKCIVQTDTWTKKQWNKNNLDKTYFGLHEMWTKNKGTKNHLAKTCMGAKSKWTKRFWTNDFGQKCIGPSWPRTKMFWMKSMWPNITQDIM